MRYGSLVLRSASTIDDLKDDDGLEKKETSLAVT